jgi:predicted restriction endonuclease
MMVADTDIKIDFERVVRDPAYRRRVVEVLNRRESLPDASPRGSDGGASYSDAAVDMGSLE